MHGVRIPKGGRIPCWLSISTDRGCTCGWALVLAILLAFATPAVGAPPANDDFSDAIVLAGALPIADPNGTNVEATDQANEPLPDPTGTTAWWRWTPASSARVCIQTGGKAGTDTVLAVFTGASLESLVLIGSNDDDPALGRASKLTLMVQAGETYQIQVGGFRGSEGPFTLTIDEAPTVHG